MRNIYAVGGIVGMNGNSVDNGGTIAYYSRDKSLVETCTFSGTIYSCAGTANGGIAGRSGVAVIDCTNEEGTVMGGDNAVCGGIVGGVQFASQNDGETTRIEGCKNQGKVEAASTIGYAGGILGQISFDSGNAAEEVVLERCCNTGEINGVSGAGGILGSVQCGGSQSDSVKINQCYNSGAVTATESYSKSGGLIGVLDFYAAGDISIENSYNAGSISGSGKIGGLLGLAELNAQAAADAVSASFTSCYNAGTITGTGSYTGGIVGQNSIDGKLTLFDCYFWDGCGVTGEGSLTANQMTDDSSWATELELSDDLWEKTENDLSDSTHLIGYLPVLKNNKQEPAPTLVRAALPDQNPFSISGLPSDTIYEDNAGFRLTADGGTGSGAITWETSDSSVAEVDASGNVTIKGVGQVTISAVKAGGETYNDAEASVEFTVHGNPIGEVTIMDLAAPVQGASPVQYINVPEDAKYEAQTSLGVGQPTLDVIWKDGEGNTVSDFEQGKTYTAVIKLQAKAFYTFAEGDVKVTLDNVQESAYESINATVDANTLTVTVTFAPTSHTHSFTTDWTSSATHHWHACQNEGCPLTESGMNGYAIHTDEDGDGICGTCGEAIGYKIRFDANGGICDTESLRTGADGRLTALPEPSREGCSFDGWFTAAEGGEEVTTDTVFSENTAIYARWTKIPETEGSGTYRRYTITASAGAGGAISPAGNIRVLRGLDKTFVITPDEDYVISDVLVDGESIGAVASYTFETVRENHTIEAVFELSEEAKEAEKNARLKAGVENTTIRLRSILGKGFIRLNWWKSPGFKVDKYEVFKSTKRYSGYGTQPYFTTKQGGLTGWYKNTKELKKGVRYYYKVRGVRDIAGETVYTKWSCKAWRLVK